MTRRDLFGSLAGALAAAMVPGEPIPKLHGDSVHDDAIGLQAALDGKWVEWPDGVLRRIPRGDPIYLGGTYFVRGQILIEREGAVWITEFNGRI